jgi:hypothetical protein
MGAEVYESDVLPSYFPLGIGGIWARNMFTGRDAIIERLYDLLLVGK